MTTTRRSSIGRRCPGETAFAHALTVGWRPPMVARERGTRIPRSRWSGMAKVSRVPWCLLALLLLASSASPAAAGSPGRFRFRVSISESVAVRHAIRVVKSVTIDEPETPPASPAPSAAPTVGTSPVPPSAKPRSPAPSPPSANGAIAGSDPGGHIRDPRSRSRTHFRRGSGNDRRDRLSQPRRRHDHLVRGRCRCRVDGRGSGWTRIDRATTHDASGPHEIRRFLFRVR